MNMIPVESRNLAAVGYSNETGTLTIQFNNGRTYEYYGVPEYEYENLMNAGSKGQYANQNIYKAYSQSEI
jgi:hypothetical protein